MRKIKKQVNKYFEDLKMSKAKEEKNFLADFTPNGMEPSNGVRHHHYKLSDVVCKLLTKMEEIENTIEVVKHFLGEELYCAMSKKVKRIKQQEKKILEEQQKLVELKGGLC